VWCFRSGLVPRWGRFRFRFVFGEGAEAFVRTWVLRQ
jgi:hypothetical protein